MGFFDQGLNQLLWYYADMEKKKCPSASSHVGLNQTVTFVADTNACVLWRRFAK